MRLSTIYKIQNKLSKKVYIGFTSKDPLERFEQHIVEAGRNSPLAIHQGLAKHGVKSFTFEIIYQSKDTNHCLKEAEQYFIEEYGSLDKDKGYNRSRGGKASKLIRK